MGGKILFWGECATNGKTYSQQQKQVRAQTREQRFSKIWTVIYKYLAALWRTRCYYVEEKRIKNEQRTLEEQISLIRCYDISVLTRTDRFLFEEKAIPKFNSTPAHK